MTEIATNPKNVCKYCKDPRKMKIDVSQGILVCTGCGLVVEDHCMDDGREWRNFASEGVDSQGPSRERADLSTGIDEITGEGGGTTVLGATNQAQRFQMLGKRVQTQTAPELNSKQKQEQMIQRYTEKAKEVANRLNLGQGVVNTCTKLLQDLAEKGKLRPREQFPWFCALVHIASREERVSRTIQDLAEANASAFGKEKGHLEKLIEKRTKVLCEDLEMRLPSHTYLDDEELMKRYVTRMGLSAQVVGPAKHIAMQAFKQDLVKKSQAAAMASAIFVVAWLLDVEQKPRLLDVANVAKVTEASVKAAYKNLRPHLRSLLPEGFVMQFKFGLEGLPPAN
eukprot:gb/GFBE01079155.1/.p1 GENE.gb/GFBE01079155.1/~~gb/GFBE01079155.1/.p1  ORF type:complete len:339 (+),score=99.21 gb/GFBE01079155.1/:1-1017(+)